MTGDAGEGAAMQIFIGPVLTREGGYAFDCWTPEEGLQRSFTYRRVEDAQHARQFDIRCRENDRADRMVACNTVDEFVQLTETQMAAQAPIQRSPKQERNQTAASAFRHSLAASA